MIFVYGYLDRALLWNDLQSFNVVVASHDVVLVILMRLGVKTTNYEDVLRSSQVMGFNKFIQ